jgi:hypothetical protein
MEITVEKCAGGLAMEIKKDEIMPFLDTLTFQERQQGYLRILVEFLIDSRKGIFYGSEIKEYWDILHNVPYFWGEDLKDFDDEWLWNEIFDNAPNPDLIIEWFFNGLPIEKSSPKYKFIQEMQARWDIEEAEGGASKRASFN